MLTEDSKFLTCEVDEDDNPRDARSTEPLLRSRRCRVAAVSSALIVTVCFFSRPWVRERSLRTSSTLAVNNTVNVVMDVETKPLSSGFCGVTANPHICPELFEFLEGTGLPGTDNILCKSNMMQSDCELSTENRHWPNKDPSLCKFKPHVLFLWDMMGSMNADPTGIPDLSDPLCGGPGLPGCPQWAAKAWIDYVDKWRPKIVAARNAGLRIASPSFNGDIFPQFEQFFQACPECSKVGSPYYIDILSFRTWMSAGNDMQATVGAIRSQATQLKAKYPGRLVILSSVGIGAGDAAGDVKVIQTSGLFQRAGNPLDAIYWSVYPNAAFSAPDARTCLTDLVLSGPKAGNFLGKVLLEKCGPER